MTLKLKRKPKKKAKGTEKEENIKNIMKQNYAMTFEKTKEKEEIKRKTVKGQGICMEQKTHKMTQMSFLTQFT